MEENDLRESSNIEDRRGQGGGQDGGQGGGFGGLSGGQAAGGLGIGAIIILSLIGWATGIDPRTLIGGAEIVTGGNQPGYSQPASPAAPPPQRTAGGVPTDAAGVFVSRILGETEDVWTEILPQQANVQYQKPTLVLYSGATQSGCGSAESAMGPFYCPLDRKVYLDTSFFHDMQTKLGGGGDFAYAYVISHEIGHHVQNLIGLLPKVEQAEQQSDKTTRNALSVKTELMADCFAGVWANHMNLRHHNITEADVQQAVATATAIGDDRLQRQSRGTVVPDSFTHGSSEQRVQWLMAGLKGGTIQACNTFGNQQ